MTGKLAALALVTLTACHAAMPTVAVQGEAGDVRAMAGQWEGTYESEQNGREGTIQFELTAAGDTARGEILMRPPADLVPSPTSSRGEQRDQPLLRSPTLLPIRFVRIQQGQVLGTLDPYIDPTCDCTVTTNFIGAVDGDEARGVFAIRGQRTWLAYGEWRAHRVRPARH